MFKRHRDYSPYSSGLGWNGPQDLRRHAMVCTHGTDEIGLTEGGLLVTKKIKIHNRTTYT
jgi:hypothetical protein